MIRRERDAVLLDVLVQPRASRTRIGPRHGDAPQRLKIAVTAPPVDGEANAAVIAALAEALGVSRAAITVVAGTSSRRKTLRITGATAAQIEALASDA
jgi:hypothetical protein